MNSDLRRRFIRDLTGDLSQVGGSRFEELASYLDGEIFARPGLGRGLNAEGASVAGAVDSVTPGGTHVVEGSSDKDYFKFPYKKLRHDLRHSVDEHPGAPIGLYSSRECGPEASTWLTQLVRRLKKIKIEAEWYDSRRIAELIVDNLLTDQAAIDRLKSFLPNLERISEQYAFSDLLPPQDHQYRGRDSAEDAIIGILASENIVAITGIGGQGKTEVACAIAHRLSDQHAHLIWVQAESITHFADLTAYDVRRNGYRHNLLGLLKSEPTLLILDNLTVDLDMDRLAGFCGPYSKIIVTSQTQMSSHSYPLDPVSIGPDAEILNADVPAACPDHVLQRVRRTIGGHPLLLRIINAHIREDGHTWEDVASDCDAVAVFEDDRRQRIADRILSRHIHTLQQELAFALWCETNVIDHAMLRTCISQVGITKLSKRAFITRSQSDVTKVHDLVYRSIEAHRVELGDHSGFDGKLSQYLSGIIHPKGLPLFRLIHRHASLVRKALQTFPDSEALQYAFIVAEDAKELDVSLLPEPRVALEKILTISPVSTLSLESLLSNIEGRYRKSRETDGLDRAKAELRGRMSIYGELLDCLSLSGEQRSIALHHRGKSHLKLQEEAEAIADFEVILRGPAPLAATKLQMARLLKQDPARGNHLLREIFDAVRHGTGSVSESVVLESIHMLRQRHLASFLDELTAEYGSFFASRIKAAAFTGFDQPYEALTTVANYWYYHAPDLLLEVMEDIPIPLPSVLNKAPEIFQVAEVIKMNGKALAERGEEAEAVEKWEQAMEYYMAVPTPTPYQMRASAENLILLRRFEEASGVLDRVPATSRDAFWHYRRAQCWKGLRDLTTANTEVTVAIETVTDARFSAAFYDLRSQIRREQDDSDFLQDLERAVQLADSGRYKRQLQNCLSEARLESEGTDPIA